MDYKFICHLLRGDLGIIIVNYQILEDNSPPINQYELEYPFSCKLVALDRETLFPIGIDLKPATNFRFELGVRYCTTCLRELDDEGCEWCQTIDWGEELPVKVRVLCNYREPDSPLMMKGKCTYVEYPCGFVENRDVCHKSYFLYFGRFNSLFKVGISRIARTKKKRLIEQGLNEAYVLTPIRGLPEALKLEDLFVETLGLPDRISSADKISSFTNRERWNWEKVHQFLNSSMDRFQIDHFKIQQDFRVERLQQVEIFPFQTISGLILWIQGPWMIFLDEDGNNRIINLKELEGYELEGM